jgi:hypothetical protein
MPADQLEHARALVARGLTVIPVPRPRPGVRPGQPGDGKVPAIAWREFQDRLPTDDELVRWFGVAPMNFAIVTGAISNVIVIDADAPDALQWCTRHFPYTPWQTETARGFHLWYRHPGVPVANRARIETGDGRLAIDIRGDRGFVIGPRSIHASGVEYREAGDWTRDDLPRFWPGWLQRATPTRVKKKDIDVHFQHTHRPTGDLLDRARRYLFAVPRPEIGCGSDSATLYAACRLVRGFGLSHADAEALLWEWAGDRPGWTRDWIACKVAHAERYGTEPIGALR